jgi:PRC-barrel domain
VAAIVLILFTPEPCACVRFHRLNVGRGAELGVTMLRSLKDFERYTASATDGDVGAVVSFLLDDERWVVRYMVVETVGFLEVHHVLISPISFRRADGSNRRFHLALTKSKIENSPGVDTDKPVSRQHERDYYQYYGYPVYWGYAGAWGTGAYPALLADGARKEAPDDQGSDDVHLRSAREIRGYHIEGSDGAIGHVEDLIVDDETWEIRYLVVATSNWWLGKNVLVAPHWASSVSWEERKVHLDLRRQAIKDSPEWNPDAAVNREYEARLYDYYGRPVYWATPTPPAEVQSSTLKRPAEARS